MVAKVNLHWLYLFALFVAETLASSFVMPTYEDCWKDIYLDAYTPAVKIKIQYQYAYQYGTILTSGTNRQCHIKVRVMHGFYIGVLMLDKYKAIECPSSAGPSNSQCKCQHSRIYLRVQLENAYSRKWYCYTEEKGTLDTDIETKTLDIAWNVTGTENSTEYSLLVFRFRKHCFSYETRTRCKHTTRCIDENLLCMPPSKFCGDGSVLCTDDHTIDNSSRTGVISGIVVTSIVIILLGIACYMCFRSKMCCSMRGRHPTESREGSNEDIRATIRGVFTVHLPYRDDRPHVPDNTGADTTNHTEDPPEYDSLNVTDLRNQTNEEMKDNLPPCYDLVMSNTNDYKVNYSPST